MTNVYGVRNSVILLGKFNSLEIAGSKSAAVEKDNAEFDAQRKAVITEALQQQHGGQKKTYGGIKQVCCAYSTIKRVGGA